MDRSDFQYQNDPLDDEGWNSDPFQELRLDVPLGDVTDLPQRCVSISTEWVPYIVAALERLKFGDMWSGDAEDVKRAYQNISTLQDLLGQGDCDSPQLGETCYDLPLYSPIIDFLPADPFHDPGEIPLGYSLPPWQIAEFDEPLNGIKAGDVVIGLIGSLLSFPPVVPLSGVPRFQLHVQGPAEVDIEFVSVVQGGIAVVFVDGFPHHWVDLQLYSVVDLLNVNSWAEIFGFVIDTFTGPTLEDSIVLDEDREYVIEAQFFPRPAIDYTIGYGGGVRSVSVCSTKEQIDMSGVVQDVRINNGTIEKYVEGLWAGVDVTDNADVLTENDLMAEDCQLKYYDLETSTWLPVPGADFLSVSDPCPITDTLEIITDSIPHLRLQHATSGEQSYFRQLASDLRIQANNRLLFYTANGVIQGMTLYETGQVSIRDGGSQFVYGQLTSNTRDRSINLALKANSAAVGTQLYVVDEQGRATNEIARVGWFSAIQQLIVNDWSSTGTKRAQGRILGQWETSTDATRKGRLILQADDYNGAREGLRVEADGNNARLGFFGVNAIDRPVLTGSDWPTILAELLVRLDDLGIVDNQTGFDFGNLFPVEMPMETHYETYWDITDAEPVANDIGLVVGTWVDGSGFREAAFGLKDGVHISRQIDEYKGVYSYKIQFQIANLSGGNVTLLALFEVADPDNIIFADSYTDGIYQVTIPVNYSSEGERVDIKLYTDDNETADIAIEALWEQGPGLPPFDRHHKPTERAVYTDNAGDWTLPTV